MQISPFISDQEMGGTCPMSQEEGASSGPGPSPKANLPSSTFRTKAWASPNPNLLFNTVHSTGCDDFLLESREQWPSGIAARLLGCAQPLLRFPNALDDLNPLTISLASLPSADRMLIAGEIFPVEHRIVP